MTHSSRKRVEWLKGGGMDDKRTVEDFETNRDSLKLRNKTFMILGALQIFPGPNPAASEGKRQRTGKLHRQTSDQARSAAANLDW